jgi:hypothetical protein
MSNRAESNFGMGLSIDYLHRMGHEVHSALGCTGFDEQNIAILDDIVFPFGLHLSFCPNGCLVAFLLKHGVVVHNRLDECLLKIYETMSAKENL